VKANAKIGALFAEEFARRKIPASSSGLTLASTDFGNVSQKVPADYIGFPVATEEISGHSHVMREASATDLAHTNAMITAEILATTAVRIATDAKLRDSLRA
jgi:metal-dependent amidase/aminoacylase/carboxypeptidase family protein